MSLQQIQLENNAAVNMGVAGIWYPVFIYFCYIPRVELLYHANSNFNFLTISDHFYSGCINLHSSQQCIRVPFSPQA